MPGCQYSGANVPVVFGQDVPPLQVLCNESRYDGKDGMVSIRWNAWLGTELDYARYVSTGEITTKEEYILFPCLMS